MANSIDVARYLIQLSNAEEEGGISNLKLQKLMYYAQGFHLAIFDQPLFEGDIEAWTHGPVHVDSYHRFKRFGSANLSDELPDDASLSDDERELLNEVFEVFGQFSAWKLRDMTHEEEPWRTFEESASIIPHEELQRYFKTQLVTDV